MESTQRERVRPLVIGAGALVMGSAAASAILSYKVHQPRASDSGDFEECYGYAGAVVTFLALCCVDIFTTAAFLANMAATEIRRAAVIHTSSPSPPRLVI